MSEYIAGLISGFGYGVLIIGLCALRAEQQASASIDKLEKKFWKIIEDAKL